MPFGLPKKLSSALGAHGVPDDLDSFHQHMITVLGPEELDVWRKIIQRYWYAVT